MLINYEHTEQKGPREVQSASAVPSSSGQRDQGDGGTFLLGSACDIKGTVYELRRRCGKPGCRCAKGELHARMVVSATEGGKTRLQVIPKGFLVEIEAKVRRYQELRRARARLGELYRTMLKVIDEMEGMRREEMSASGKKRSARG